MPRLQRLGGDSDAIQPSIGKSSRRTTAVAKALTVHGPAAPATFTCPAALHLFSCIPGAGFKGTGETGERTDKGGPEEALSEG